MGFIARFPLDRDLVDTVCQATFAAQQAPPEEAAHFIAKGSWLRRRCFHTLWSNEYKIPVNPDPPTRLLGKEVSVHS